VRNTQFPSAVLPNEVTMLATTQSFLLQVSTNAFLTDLFYVFTTMGAFVGLMALTLLDGSMVQQKNLVDTLVQKVISAFVGGIAVMIAGYGIWNWQFDQAYGVPEAFCQSLANWWILGPNMRTFAEHLDPSVLPGADAGQIFNVFFFAFGALTGAFVHGMGIERLKPSACYVMSALVAGILMPLLAYLTWGPVGPLTNRGLHDFVGCFALYMNIGVFSLILSWRLGPRIDEATGLNILLLTVGAMLLMVAIPVFVIGCGYLEPGVGYFGISNTSSGLGIVFANVFVALGGGALAGAVIAYRKRNPVYVLLGPIAGYIVCTASFDIAAPWQCYLVSLMGPFVMLFGGTVMTWMKIDDHKIVPLALGPSIVGALAAGVVGSGLPTGGMQGLTGAFAFQHAHISLGMQAIGILVTLGCSGVAGLVVVFVVEKTIGLRVPRAVEQAGLDRAFWAPGSEPLVASGEELQSGMAPR
jgi:ammonium transporter, Amt family